MGRKYGFQELRVVSHSFYVKPLLIQFVSILRLEVWPKVKLFSPDWPELYLIWVELGPNWWKIWFRELRVVLRSFYVQLLLIIPVSCVNWDFYQKSNFNPDWTELGLIRYEKGSNREKNMIIQSRE